MLLGAVIAGAMLLGAVAGAMEIGSAILVFDNGVKDATEASELNGDDIPPMLRDESTVILLL